MRATPRLAALLLLASAAMAQQDASSVPPSLRDFVQQSPYRLGVGYRKPGRIVVFPLVGVDPPTGPLALGRALSMAVADRLAAAYPGMSLADATALGAVIPPSPYGFGGPSHAAIYEQAVALGGQHALFGTIRFEYPLHRVTVVMELCSAPRNAPGPDCLQHIVMVPPGDGVEPLTLDEAKVRGQAPPPLPAPRKPPVESESLKTEMDFTGLPLTRSVWARINPEPSSYFGPLLLALPVFAVVDAVTAIVTVPLDLLSGLVSRRTEAQLIFRGRLVGDDGTPRGGKTMIAAVETEHYTGRFIETFTLRQSEVRVTTAADGTFEGRITAQFRSGVPLHLFLATEYGGPGTFGDNVRYPLELKDGRVSTTAVDVRDFKWFDGSKPVAPRKTR